MVSTFSDNFRFELIQTGDQSGVWGITTNGTLGTLIEDALGGVSDVVHDDSADYFLTVINGAADEARQMVIEVSGILTEARNVVCPNVEKLYIVRNSTTGNFNITFKTAAGTGVTVANGRTAFVYCDGVNVNDVIGLSAINNANWEGPALALANGGTGAETAADARTNLELETVEQAEAEAGTGTTTRAWTSQRVRQAVVSATTNTRRAVITAVIGDINRPTTVSTGVAGYIYVPFSGTIQSVVLLADRDGSVVVDIWKDTFANYPPTNADSITSATPPTITTADSSEDDVLTGWTVDVTAGDVFGFNVDSVTTIRQVTVALEVLKS